MRPARSSPFNFAARHKLTAGLIERAVCTPGRPFVLLRDADETGLRLRITAVGGKAWQYETRLPGGKLFTRSLGKWPDVDVKAAQAAARHLRSIRESGRDPREVEQEDAKRAREARAIEDHERHEALRRVEQQEQARATREQREGLTVGTVWEAYIEARKAAWGNRNLLDHQRLAAEGGVPRRRLPGVMTKPGPLHQLMGMRLVDLTPEAVLEWARAEAIGGKRPARVRLALRLLRTFLNWVSRQKAYAGLVQPQVGKGAEVREAAGKPSRKADALERSDLALWFREVRALANPVVSAYLQTLLLTGARPGEVQRLRWTQVNFERQQLNIRDKVEGDRTIPLTPYVAALLRGLPRRNAFVFSSTKVLSQTPQNIERRRRDHERAGTVAPSLTVVDASASGHIIEAGAPHRDACTRAGLSGLTLHGLRRSFASLTEWLEIPAGVVAQIQGHKPSATAEKHYKVRPVDLLRVHHDRIEAWVLKEAGIEFQGAAAAASQLTAVA